MSYVQRWKWYDRYTSFGDLEREDKEYAIMIIKAHWNRNVIGLGYKVHVLHNYAKGIFDSMSIDMEVLVIQIFPHTHRSNGRPALLLGLYGKRV